MKNVLVIGMMMFMATSALAGNSKLSYNEARNQAVTALKEAAQCPVVQRSFGVGITFVDKTCVNKQYKEAIDALNSNELTSRHVNRIQETLMLYTFQAASVMQDEDENEVVGYTLQKGILNNSEATGGVRKAVEMAISDMNAIMPL